MDDVETKIRAARISLLLKKPFWGQIATRLKIIECNKDWNKTMATDGKHLYFNKDFTNALPDGAIQFIICHEILHCAFEHFLRSNGRKHSYWNMATDYAINWILQRDGIGEVPNLPAREGHSTLKPGTPCPPDTEGGILLNEKYKDMNAEQIYEILMREKAKERNSLDSHIYVKEGGDGEGNGSSGGDGDIIDMPSLTPEEARDIRDSMREAMIDAVQNSQNRNAGSVPGEIARMIKDFLEPKINWRDLIATSIQSTVKSDVSFIRPARKSTNEFILPGRIPEDTINVACAVDVSGSIGPEQIRDFLSEIHGIMLQYNTFNITLYSFDTRCQALATFTQDNQDEIDEWVPLGGGGTHIKSAFEFLKEKEICCDCFIIFTDLEDSSQNDVDENEYPDVVWIIQNPWQKDILPPFGRFARYEP